jgi:hypothetical protein
MGRSFRGHIERFERRARPAEADVAAGVAAARRTFAAIETAA